MPSSAGSMPAGPEWASYSGVEYLASSRGYEAHATGAREMEDPEQQLWVQFGPYCALVCLKASSQALGWIAVNSCLDPERKQHNGIKVIKKTKGHSSRITVPYT